MKHILSMILMLCIVISLFPTVAFAEENEKTTIEEANFQKVQAEENKTLRVFTDEDYAAVEAVWDRIRTRKEELSEKKSTLKQTIAAVAEIVENSENYAEGSLVYHEDCFTWKTVEGIACLYPYEEEECDRGESVGDPIVPPEGNYEHISYAKKGAPAGQDVYLIGPYYGVESNFTDHYKTVAKSVASASGGSYTLYSYTNATIDNVAKAFSNGSIVLVDSHGTYYTLNNKTRSYLRLKTGTGITSYDYDNDYAYYVDSSYIVTGEAITAHMTKDAPNSFIWYGICSGMRFDNMCLPVIERGVESCLGYSRTVSFEYDRLWLSSFCNALISGKTVAQAAAAMKSEVGKWDRCQESATDTFDEAISNAKAFPIIVSAEDDYPNDVQGLQTVYSSWKLTACKHTDVSYVPAAAAGCISTGYSAHYLCSGCDTRFTTSACTTRLSMADVTIAALGHSMSNGVCARCGNDESILWHFWENYEESQFRWAGRNFKSGTVTRVDVSGRGVLYSTSNGDDHYVYNRQGHGSVGYTVSSGDVIEVRFRTVGLPSASIGTTGAFELWYTTPTEDSNFTQSKSFTASYTKKESQWQTVSFTATSSFELNRLLFDVFEEETTYAGSRLEIDYVYAGPAADAPSKRTETSLLFDFKNDDAASRRYVNSVYGDINYDRDGWKGNSSSIHSLSYQNDSVSFSMLDSAEFAYIQTTDAGGTLTALPLNYTPRAGDVVQIRMKIEDVQALDGKTPYMRLYYITDNATSGVSYNNYTAFPNLTDKELDGTYFTVTATMADNFTTASVVNAIRPQIGNIQNISGRTGKITIDYIYIGQESETPENLNHTHEYGEDGLCIICGVGHVHDLSGSVTTTRAATCTVAGAGTKKCSDCGEMFSVSIAKTAHSFSNNVCTVCGYVNCGQLLHFAANTPSASYTWNTYDGTTTVDTSTTGILSTTLSSSASDHYMTMNEEIGYAVQSGDVIEIKYKCNKARTSASSFELRYTTVTNQIAFSSNTTSMTKSITFAANTWTTVQFTPTVGQTVYRLFLEPFLSDDSSFAGKTFEIDYIYIGPANGAPSKAKTTAPLYFDFTNDTTSQHRFVSSTYGYMQTIESNLAHWAVNSSRATKAIANGLLTLTVQESGSPYAQISKISGATDYTNAPLSYTLDGTDYVQVSVKFDNCVNLSDSGNAYITLGYLTDKTIEHENPSDQTTYNYGARIEINPTYLTDGQYHTYTIPLSSALTVGEKMINFRLSFNNVGKAGSGSSVISVDYLAIGALSELPLSDIYSVQFKDADAKTLKTQMVAKGELAYYNGAMTKAADDSKHYIFNGWDKALGPITSNTTLTASFIAESHTQTNGVVTPATCVSDGYTTYTCSVCGVKTVADYVKGEHVEELVNVITGSCTQNGYTGDLVCKTCGVTLKSGTTITANGHDYGEPSVAIEPTCTEDGVARYTCQNCTYSYTQVLPATQHSSTTTELTEPTCTAQGLAIVICDDCQETVETRILEALGHDYVGKITDATCTQAGYTTFVCSRCNDTYVGAHVSALGHNYQGIVTPPTCTQRGYTTFICSGCTATYVDAFTAIIPHSYNYSNLGNGTHAVRCAYGCNYSATENCNYIDQVCICGAVQLCGHENTEMNITIEATCTTQGSAEIFCTDCGEMVGTTVIEKLGHDIIAVAAKAATCEENGCRKHWICNACGTYYADAIGEYPLPSSYFIIPAIGHSLVFREAVAPTCSESGYAQHYGCSQCDKCFFDAEGQFEVPKYYIEIAPTGHSYAYTNNGADHSIVCANCSDSTNEAHSYVDGTCACGAVKVTEPVYKPNANLTLTMSISVGTEMQVFYNVLNSRVKNFESFYIEVVKEVVGGESVTTIYSLENGNLTAATNAAGNISRYSATYTGIFAMEMGDNFTATVYAVEADGTINYGPSVTSSIKSFLMQQLADETALAEIKTLAVDMLNYGAAAQVQFDYDVENLVNADLTDAQKALGTQEIPAATDNTAAVGNGSAVVTSVSLQSKVMLYLTFRYRSNADSNLKVVIKDAKGKILSEYAPYQINTANCKAIYDNVGARQMRELITIELYDNDTLVSQSITWSVESYVAQTRANEASSEALVNAVNAMLAYGDSAALYLEATGQ